MIKLQLKSWPFPHVYLCWNASRSSLGLVPQYDGRRNVPGQGSEDCAAPSAQLPALQARLNSAKIPLGLLKRELEVAQFSAHGWFLGWAPGVSGRVAGTHCPDLGMHSLARWFCLINLWDCWLSPGSVRGRHHLALGAQKQILLACRWFRGWCATKKQKAS